MDPIFGGFDWFTIKMISPCRNSDFIKPVELIMNQFEFPVDNPLDTDIYGIIFASNDAYAGDAIWHYFLDGSDNGSNESL